jgi:hypothetical protein
VTGFDSSAVTADQVLTVTLGGKTAVYHITVVEAGASDLEVAKTAAAAELNGYKTQADYSEVNWTIIVGMKADGVTAINGATTLTDVADALASAKADIDAVTTLAEEKAAAKGALAEALATYTEADYSSATGLALTTAKASATRR